MSRHLLIINTHSGGGRTADRVTTLLDDLSRPDAQYETAFTDAPGHAALLAEGAAKDYATLIAVGGDGTVSEVATGLVKSGAVEVCLGILPMGTGNDIAQGLGIRDSETALAALRGFQVRPIDACEVCYTVGARKETRMSLIGVGIGYPAEVTSKATKRVKRILRHWSYLYATIACAASYRCPKMRIEAEGHTWEEELLLCAVSNLEWTGGQSICMAPGAKCDDGWLNVLLFRESSRLRSLMKLPQVVKGTHGSLPEVEYFPSQRITVDSNPAARLNIDGDLIGTTPAELRVLPGALKVKVA